VGQDSENTITGGQGRTQKGKTGGTGQNAEKFLTRRNRSGRREVPIQEEQGRTQLQTREYRAGCREVLNQDDGPGSRKDPNQEGKGMTQRSF
jgi:hypothetical protein